MTLSTPVRVSRLNLSSLLTDLTPNTQTWSRLKAALSVHRKGVGNTRTNTPVLSSLQRHIQKCLLSCSSSPPSRPFSSAVLHTPKNSASVFTPRRAELVDVSQDLFASPFRSSLPKGLQSQLVSENSVCSVPPVVETLTPPHSSHSQVWGTKLRSKVTKNKFCQTQQTKVPGPNPS